MMSFTEPFAFSFVLALLFFCIATYIVAFKALDYLSCAHPGATVDAESLSLSSQETGGSPYAYGELWEPDMKMPPAPSWDMKEQAVDDRIQAPVSMAKLIMTHHARVQQHLVETRRHRRYYRYLGSQYGTVSA